MDRHNNSSVGMDPTQQIRGKEKELMHGLNQRLAGFIDKVHLLQQHNHLLERELSEIRGKAKPASLLEEEYGAELQRLRQLLQEVGSQKHQIQSELLNLEDELCSLRTQQEQEERCKAAAQSTILILKRDISDALQAKEQLDKKAQALEDEIHIMKRNHRTEMSQMFAQVQDAQVAPRVQEFGGAGVTAALRHIRAQLEERTAYNRPREGETFRSQFARLTEEAEAKREALKELQQEIQEHRRRLQAKTVELDCANGTREALERQLREVEDRHKEEVIHYQNTIKELENELINCKFDVSGYLREYQDLLNVKMALDVEILSYRKLLCGEEARLSTVSDTHTSLPYIYHQSPVYTLPSLSRPGGPHRRAEPQYKFVEEIITETTREIEMSEFEETGSEETEAGGDEPKRDSGSSEEEMDNKDNGKDGGKQMRDSEQNQKASVGSSVNGGDDEHPNGEDDGVKGQKEAEKSEEHGDSEGDSSIDKNSQSQVLSDGEESKQSEKIKGEEEAARMMVTHQKDLSVKADLETEILKKSNDVDRCIEKDSFGIVQAKESGDGTSAQVSNESEQGLGGKLPIKDEAQTLAAKTADKTTDSAAEDRSALSVLMDEFSEKAQESSLSIPNQKGKETAIGVDREAKSTKDAKHDCSNGQDKESAHKHTAESFKVETQIPKSGEKAEMVQTGMPKEREEIKDFDQGTAESSQGLTSKLSEVSSKVKEVESSKAEQ